MELRMNFTSFIKIKDASRINDICGEILDYSATEDGVVGSLGINGKYLKNDLEKENQFSESIPFNIVFTTPHFELVDLDCINLDYDLVEGRGIEVSFDIKVDYNELDNDIEEIDTIGERTSEIEDNEVINEENTQIEDIKNEITEEVSSKLEETLKFKEDNLPTQDADFIKDLDEKRTKIKVCYYSSDKELETVCSKNDISLDKVFKDNKNNDISKYQRIIIK